MCKRKCTEKSIHISQEKMNDTLLTYFFLYLGFSVLSKCLWYWVTLMKDDSVTTSILREVPDTARKSWLLATEGKSENSQDTCLKSFTGNAPHAHGVLTCHWVNFWLAPWGFLYTSLKTCNQPNKLFNFFNCLIFKLFLCCSDTSFRCFRKYTCMMHLYCKKAKYFLRNCSLVLLYYIVSREVIPLKGNFSLMFV